MTEYHEHKDDCPFKFATLDVCDCVEKNMLDRIEALTAKLAKAVEAAFKEGFLAGTQDGWLNNPRIKMEWKRSRARSTLAEIKGESHE